ncbi:unnamed protein product, partial [Nesidiocoris tenuis]
SMALANTAVQLRSRWRRLRSSAARNGRAEDPGRQSFYDRNQRRSGCLYAGRDVHRRRTPGISTYTHELG